MGSKISKQKQIFSLLHNKYGNLWNNSDTEVNDLQISKSEKFSNGYSSHLINKVYNFYKSIIQSLNSGLIALDLEGEITFINQMAAQMLDYSKEELLGKILRKFLAKMIPLRNVYGLFSFHISILMIEKLV